MLLSGKLWLKFVKIHGDADCISTHTIHVARSRSSRRSQRTCLIRMKNYLRLRKVIFSAHKTEHGPTKDAENDL